MNILVSSIKDHNFTPLKFISRDCLNIVIDNLDPGSYCLYVLIENKPIQNSDKIYITKISTSLGFYILFEDDVEIEIDELNKKIKNIYKLKIKK
jgi:hypothetical protein